MSVKNIDINIKDMQCSGCEIIIEEAVQTLPGVVKAQADYSKGRASFSFDTQRVSAEQITAKIEEKGYNIQDAQIKNRFRLIYFILILVIIGGITFWGKSMMPGLIPQLSAQMSYAMLFGIGFLTGFHCIGMCGGFVVSYASQSQSKLASIASHLSYGFGKTLSYSAIGAGFGALGAAITITLHARGIVALISSVFLLLYGLKMLDLLPGLRRFTLRLPKRYNQSVHQNIQKNRNPLVIGVFSGLLLGCGPLQVMYILAAGTGDPIEGATLLFFFGLGTLLPLLSFGLIANILSRNTIYEIVRVSGVLVIAMGVMMANRGLKLTGSGYDLNSVWPIIQQTIISLLNQLTTGV